jgi:hypothetical protein
MARDYCTLANIKRLLRTANRKINTSEAYKELGYNADNIGDIKLIDVTIEESYVGHERFTATFSDSTSFVVSGEESGYLGTGNIGSLFSCSRFSIPSTFWTGDPETADVVYFVSDSDVSTDDAEEYIVDASNFIRNKLGELFGDSTNIPWETDLTLDIPDGLVFASIRLAAYYIFTSAIAGTVIDQESPVIYWYKEGLQAIEDFLAWYKKETQVGAPRWRSREVLFTEIGISGLEEDVIDVTEDTTLDHSYDRN